MAVAVRTQGGGGFFEEGNPGDHGQGGHCGCSYHYRLAETSAVWRGGIVPTAPLTVAAFRRYRGNEKRSRGSLSLWKNRVDRLLFLVMMLS